jgi:hypothetical protein
VLVALGQQEAQSRWLHGRDRQVELQRLALELHPRHRAVLGQGETADRGIGPGLDAELARPRHHRVDQALVAADDVAHFLAAAAFALAGAGHPAGAGPEVGGRQPRGVAVEARVEQRFPDPLPDLVAADPPQPGLERDRLQLLVGAAQLALGDERPQPQPRRRT